MRIALLAAILASSVQATGAGTPGRQGIVFILGRDEQASSPMFGQAEAHWRSRAPQDLVVNDLRSLGEVRDHLARHPPKNGQPWGLVQLVVHGNGGGQMALPLFPGGEFLMPSGLEEAVDRGTFVPLPDALLDDQSEIRIHGCALGGNQSLLRALSRALGGQDPRRPLVRASRAYICYQAPDLKGAVPIRFHSQAWRFVHPPGRPPSLEAMSARIHATNPEWARDLDLAGALLRTSPRFPGDTFCHRAPATFRWTRVFTRPEDCPVLTDPVRLRCWLREMPPFFQHLDEAGLSVDQMEWSATRITHAWKGSQRPAVRVLGTGQALYLLRSLNPEPGWEDPRYFAAER